MNFQDIIKDPKTNWRYVLIVIILAFFVGGGILAWQWLDRIIEEENKLPEVKMTGRDTITEQKLAEDTVKEYVIALRSRDDVLPYLTGEAEEQIQKWLLSFGTSNPYLGSFEILSSKKLDTTEFEFIVREYQEYTGEGIIGYNDETLVVAKVDDKYLISSIERGDYVDIKETASWKTYRNEEYGFEVKYPGYLRFTKQQTERLLEIYSNSNRDNASDKFRIEVIDKPLDGREFLASDGTHGNIIFRYSVTQDQWVYVGDYSGPSSYGTDFYLQDEYYISNYRPQGGDMLRERGYVPVKYKTKGDLNVWVGKSTNAHSTVGGDAWQIAFIESPNKEFTVKVYMRRWSWGDPLGMRPISNEHTIFLIIDTFEFTKKTADWKSYRNEEYGFEFRYPEELGQKYIKTHIWPPKATAGPINPNFICEESQTIKTPQGYGNQKEIIFNSSKYCVLTVSEGAAGTTYVIYRYIINRDNNQLTLEFVLKFPNCGVFSGINNKMEECEKEKRDFEPTGLVNKILSTFRFLE